MKKIIIIITAFFAFSFVKKGNNHLNPKPDKELITEDLNLKRYIVVTVFFEYGTSPVQIEQYRNLNSSFYNIINYRTCLGATASDMWLIELNSSSNALPDFGSTVGSNRYDDDDLEIVLESLSLLKPSFVHTILGTPVTSISYFNNITCLSF